MLIKSQKERYEDDPIFKFYDYDIFVWGEEIVDKQLFVYPKKLKEINGYQLLKGHLKMCGLVFLDVRKRNYIKCISANVDMCTGNIYLPEQVFNSVWRVLRRSVEAGIILMTEQQGSCPISKPEEMVSLIYLERPDSKPMLKEDAIKYKQAPLTEEEKYRNSRKQSMLDNPKLIYFYADDDLYYHDKECELVKTMPATVIKAADTISSLPEGRELCPRCKRKILFRTACYPNTKQMPVCDRIFRKKCNSMKLIEHYVLDDRMKFHATTLEELQVTCGEDTWIIRGLDGKELELWHNNYVRTSPTERYITDGYHDQKIRCSSLNQMLKYIEGYSWQKHLEGEKKQMNVMDESDAKTMVESNLIDEEKVSVVVDSDTNENAAATGIRWYVRVWKWMKRIVGR